MTERMRTPFFLLALALILITVVIETGSASKLQQATDAAQALNSATPGQGILALALIDGQLLYTALLIGLSFIVPESVQGRTQGIVSLIVSILVIVLGIMMFRAALTLLILMVTLLLSPIFGTIAYFGLFGTFNLSGARATLGMAMPLKLAFCACLVFAHQRFLTDNKGLVVMSVTTLVATFLLQLLHGFVPSVLVSITDTIGALIAIVFALIWAVLMAISSVISIFKAIV